MPGGLAAWYLASAAFSSQEAAKTLSFLPAAVPARSSPSRNWALPLPSRAAAQRSRMAESMLGGAFSP